MNELLKLYGAFFRIGLFTFGGGYAMLPMLQREVVNKYHWATDEELLDCYAIGQCTPGVIAVNTATYVGYRRHGVVGGIFATLGVISPSLVIITVIAMALSPFMSNPYVMRAFAGIRVAVTALIAASVIKLAKKGVKDVPGIVLCVAAFLVVSLLGASPIWVTLGAALCGIVLGKVRERK